MFITQEQLAEAINEGTKIGIQVSLKAFNNLLDRKVLSGDIECAERVEFQTILKKILDSIDNKL